VRETSKTLDLLTEEEQLLLSGRGLDIGCGDDPVRPDVERFDVEQGDANRILEFVRDVESYDYVFSSHCLEHMHDPRRAIRDWWTLVKPGGAMIVVVPDEDLYEQGYWPSLFNPDHKATFSISKERSWSSASCSLTALTRTLDDAEIVGLRPQSSKYDMSYLVPRAWPHVLARSAVRARNVVTRWLPQLRGTVDGACRLLRFPIDQTMSDAVAQNVLVLRKKAPASTNQ
jgi:SAM-dependent methyltransferase